jgi:hypothetical protein
MQKNENEKNGSVFWRARLEKCRTALMARHFEVMLADTAEQACDIVLGQVLPQSVADLQYVDDYRKIVSAGTNQGCADRRGPGILAGLWFEPRLRVQSQCGLALN